MKVLFVVSGNVGSMPFVEEQRASLVGKGCIVDYFFIKGHGLYGYLKNHQLLQDHLIEGQYDLIHAHYGLAGMLAVIQRKVPVIITFHGSDINQRRNIPFSLIASRLSNFNIFVCKSMPRKIWARGKYAVIPCGVDTSMFCQIDYHEARKKMGLDLEKKYILFSSSFDNPVKNFELAKSAVSNIKDEVEILELKGYTRPEVNLLLNACDLLLMTSLSEGSPQVIKEALACGTPIVSTRVGAVPELIDGISGCYLADSDPVDLADRIDAVLRSPERISGYQSLPHLSLEVVATEIINIYSKVCRVS